MPEYIFEIHRYIPQVNNDQYDLHDHNEIVDAPTLSEAQICINGRLEENPMGYIARNGREYNFSDHKQPQNQWTNQDDDAYLRSMGFDPGTEHYRTKLETMEFSLDTYGTNNRWWCSDDPRTRAYYDVLLLEEKGQSLIPMKQLLQDVAILLGRTVDRHELAHVGQRAKLQQEVKEAWRNNLEQES